jgi:hypothetical protein
MKKTIPVGIMLIAMLATAMPVVASDASDTKVSLGLKLWSNTWKETVTSEGGSTQKFNNGSEPMVGPSLHVRFWKDWFADITYLTAFGDYESPDWIASGDKMKFERTDVDLMAGYLVHDPYNTLNVGLFVAYKTIDASASYTNQAAGLNNVDVGTWRLGGPGLGVLAEKNLDESTLLYGNIAYLFLEQEFAYSSGGVSRFDTGGWALDVAVAHAFTKAISANVGIKYQRFKGEKDNGDDITDSFSGLTAGIAYTF